MAQSSTIEWTEIIDRDGRRRRYYPKANPRRPGQQERRRMAAKGLRWCRRCEAWLPSSAVRSGLCRQHTRELYREGYASDGGRIRRQKIARKRRIAPLPAEAVALLTESFGGRCAYCPAPATTFDHVVPVAQGGETEPGNVVPACVSCNSSKGARDLAEWASRRQTFDPALALLDTLALAAAA